MATEMTSFRLEVYIEGAQEVPGKAMMTGSV